MLWGTIYINLYNINEKSYYLQFRTLGCEGVGFSSSLLFDYLTIFGRQINEIKLFLNLHLEYF